MKIISFELKMPNVGSWNRKWTGESKKHYIIMKMTDNEFEKLSSDSYYYNFGDGWGASISIEIIDSKEAIKRRKLSKGFCGYDWMVYSIIKNDEIIIKGE